jgi:hypothetical protein
MKGTFIYGEPHA